MKLLKSLTAFVVVAALAGGTAVSGSGAAEPSGPSAPGAPPAPPGPSAHEQELELPDLGSPATAAVTLDEEYQVGRQWAYQMRSKGLVLEDPEISDYIQQICHSLLSHAEEGHH